MRARLTQIEHGRRLASVALDRPELVIGRDPNTDFVLEFGRVSRRHAIVRTRDEHHTLADLGSSNGTRVNGFPVGDEVILRPGDEIELAGEATLVYELDTAAPGAGLARVAAIAAAALVLLAAVGGGAYLWLGESGPAPLDPEAIDLAREGYAAAQAGNANQTKSKLKAAVGRLYHEGYLSDVPRGEFLPTALQQLGESLEGQPDLNSVFEQALVASRPRPQPKAGKPLGCRLDRVGARDLEGCLRERIELVMLALWQDPTEVPDDFHREVGERLRREHAFIGKSLARGRPVVPALRKAFEEQNMPPLLHYLAMIESGYRSEATSPAKAAGMWQFMPRTARQYGLRVDGIADDRRDVEKSTRAAVQYLKGLAFEFGGDALLLALAGYNRGENAVRRALKKLDNPFEDRSYWRLVEEDLLPEETAKYVPRFMAAAVAGEGGLPDRELLEAAGY